MIDRIVVLVAAVLFSAAALSGDKTISPELKVDLDGLVESGVVQPVGGVSTAGQPDQAALEVFAKSGYTTVIDLRGAEENRGLDEPAVVESLGMRYVPFPITGVEAISFENAAKLDELIASSDGPVLVHCGSSNRVGALFALSKRLKGADPDDAMSYGVEAGLTSLAAPVQDLLDQE
ncbi:MAG TPA: sulfur transferase domain-containing protein [Woeseiaceae bacterium]|nr:sulfur transferase domain-containing protein [Woeseiaceae bacterium]